MSLRRADYVSRMSFPLLGCFAGIFLLDLALVSVLVVVRVLLVVLAVLVFLGFIVFLVIVI